MIVGEAVAIVVLAAVLVFVWDELFAILGAATSREASPQRSTELGAGGSLDTAQAVGAAAVSLASRDAALPCSDGRTVEGRHL